MLRDRPQMRSSSSSRSSKPTAQARRRGEGRLHGQQRRLLALLPKPANPGFSALPGHCTNSCVHSPPAIKRPYRPR
jgi:hypothetical protein